MSIGLGIFLAWWDKQLQRMWSQNESKWVWMFGLWLDRYLPTPAIRSGALLQCHSLGRMRSQGTVGRFGFHVGWVSWTVLDLPRPESRDIWASLHTCEEVPRTPVTTRMVVERAGAFANPLKLQGHDMAWHGMTLMATDCFHQSDQVSYWSQASEDQVWQVLTSASDRKGYNLFSGPFQGAYPLSV